MPQGFLQVNRFVTPQNLFSSVRGVINRAKSRIFKILGINSHALKILAGRFNGIKILGDTWGEGVEQLSVAGYRLSVKKLYTRTVNRWEQPLRWAQTAGPSASLRSARDDTRTAFGYGARGLRLRSARDAYTTRDDRANVYGGPSSRAAAFSGALTLWLQHFILLVCSKCALPPVCTCQSFPSGAWPARPGFVRRSLTMWGRLRLTERFNIEVVSQIAEKGSAG
jgi:hypothetical protein